MKRFFKRGDTVDLESIWKTFLEKIKNNINDISYETWFSEAQLIAIEDGVVKILVPSHVHKKNLKVNYIDLIEEKFTEVTGTNFKFEFFIEEELENDITINTDEIGIPSNNFETNLDPKYQFDNFVLGKSNKFAWILKLA